MSYETLKPWIQRFVDAYVASAHAPNPTAAIRAVRPELKRPDVQASKLMASADVQAAIHERLTRRRELSELDEKWVLDRLRTVVERSMQQDAKGRLVDSSGANRALELIGKHFAMFTDKVESTVNHVHTMSDAEIDTRLLQLLGTEYTACH